MSGSAYKNRVLTKALLEAGRHFAISKSEISPILNACEIELAGFGNEECFIDYSSEKGKRAIYFLKIYEYLTNIAEFSTHNAYCLGGDE